VKFLVGKAAQRRWPTRSTAEIVRIVEDTFSAAFDESPDQVTALCDTEEPLDEHAMRAALHYVEQWRVTVWVAQQNRDKGVEPPSEDCFVEHARRLEAYPEEVRPRSLASGTASAQRMRGSRWRRLWSGSYAALPSHDAVPRNEVLEKATETVPM
jgi:hypothetical protein